MPVVGSQMVQGLFGIVQGLQFHPGKERAYLGCLLLLGFGPENAEPVLLSSIGSRNIKHLAIMLFFQFCGPELVCSQFPPSRVLLWLPFTLFAEFILREEEQEICLCHFIQTGSL